MIKRSGIIKSKKLYRVLRKFFEIQILIPYLEKIAKIELSVPLTLCRWNADLQHFYRDIFTTMWHTISRNTPKCLKLLVSQYFNTPGASYVFCLCEWLLHIIYTLTTHAGVMIGLLLGFLLRLVRPSPTAIELIKFPGEILMRVLKMMIIPIICSSIIAGNCWFLCGTVNNKH